MSDEEEFIFSDEDEPIVLQPKKPALTRFSSVAKFSTASKAKIESVPSLPTTSKSDNYSDKKPQPSQSKTLSSNNFSADQSKRKDSITRSRTEPIASIASPIESDNLIEFWDNYFKLLENEFKSATNQEIPSQLRSLSQAFKNKLATSKDVKVNFFEQFTTNFFLKTYQ